MITTSGLTINEMPALPIWRDIIFSTEGTGLSSLSAVDFVVSTPGVGGVTLYSGRAAKRPGDTYVQIRLNDIVAGFLKQTADGAVDYPTDGYYDVSGKILKGPSKAFQIRASDPENAGTYADASFVAFADWSYDYSEDFTFQPVSVFGSWYDPAFRGAPINWKADPRQYLLFSMMKSCTLWINGLQGSPVPGSFSGIAVYMYNHKLKYENGEWIDNPNYSSDEGVKTIAVRAGDLPDVAISSISTEEMKKRYGVDLFGYKDSEGAVPIYYATGGQGWEGTYPIAVRSSCARYCLYYLNAFGGWDWFLIQGRAVVSDSITRATVERRAASDLLFSRLQRRGTDVLSEELTKHLEAHTHWLSDDEASRMWHLTESANVYIHDLQEDIIYPAVLTGSEHVEKTYKNQGCKLVSYQIDLDFAVIRERR